WRLTSSAARRYFAVMDGASQIRDWPTDERPRERLYHKGAAALSDAELLAIQLGTGVPGTSALDVAHGLLAEFGGLQELAAREVAAVAAGRGGGRAKAGRLAGAWRSTAPPRPPRGRGPPRAAQRPRPARALEPGAGLRALRAPDGGPAQGSLPPRPPRRPERAPARRGGLRGHAVGEPGPSARGLQAGHPGVGGVDHPAAQ